MVRSPESGVRSNWPLRVFLSYPYSQFVGHQSRRADEKPLRTPDSGLRPETQIPRAPDTLRRDLATLMSLLRTSVTVALIAALPAAGCHRREEAPAPSAVATIGSRAITSDDFTRYLERNAGTALSQLAPAAASALLDQYIGEILLAERAGDSGIAVSSAAVANAVRNDPTSTPVEKRDEMKRARFLSDVAAKLPPASAAEVTDYYQKHMEEFRSGEQVHARQILVHTDADAAAAKKELAAGETFEAVSKKYSKAPNAARGGDIGFVERGQLPKIFEEVIFSLKPGMVSDVVKIDTDFFHIFKVDEVRPAGQLDLEAAKPLIEERLREEKLSATVDRLISETATAKGVIVHKERAGFAYAGRYPTE